MKNPAVYIMANQTNSTIYIGVTSDLIRRVYQHRNHLLKGFTQKYNIEKLVFYEVFLEMNEAIKREKQLKNWKRAWKNDLVESMNPHWVDLWDELIG